MNTSNTNHDDLVQTRRVFELEGDRLLIVGTKATDQEIEICGKIGAEEEAIVVTRALLGEVSLVQTASAPVESLSGHLGPVVTSGFLSDLGGDTAAPLAQQQPDTNLANQKVVDRLKDFFRESGHLDFDFDYSNLKVRETAQINEIESLREALTKIRDGDIVHFEGGGYKAEGWLPHEAAQIARDALTQSQGDRN